MQRIHPTLISIIHIFLSVLSDHHTFFLIVSLGSRGIVPVSIKLIPGSLLVLFTLSFKFQSQHIVWFSQPSVKSALNSLPYNHYSTASLKQLLKDCLGGQTEMQVPFFP